MHVIMEGVLPRHVKALIRYCICEKHFLTLNQLNRNIANFDYGYSEKVNQPAHLTGIISLQMTRKLFSQVRHLVCTPILVCIVPIIRFMIHCLVLGKLYKTVLVQTTCAPHTHTHTHAHTHTHMHTHTCLLPLMIGEFIPSDDLNWICYIELLSVIVLCTSFEFTNDTIEDLRLAIEKYLLDFNKLYPNS